MLIKNKEKIDIKNCFISKNKMDEYYESLFDLRDIPNNDDLYYYKIIPTFPFKIYKRVLDKNMKIINNSNLSISEWAKFKYNLLEYEKQWKINIFKWIPNLNNTKNSYVGIKVDELKLENKSSRYFQIILALEDIWFGDNLEDIWQEIDLAIENSKKAKKDILSNNQYHSLEEINT